jgi:translation initiation factor 5A
MSVTHKHASSIKKGDVIVMDGEACKVKKISTSRPGKHGHAKVRVEGVGLIDEKKRQQVMPGDEDVEVPIIDKRNAQILSTSGDKATVMDMESYETFDLQVPDDLQDDAEEGKIAHYWVILEEKVFKQVKSDG